MTIGVVARGVRKIFSYGAAKPDSVFEIGSITKTFTGLILAQMVEQKKVRLTEPVRALLPTGTVAPPTSRAEITLLDLCTHRSGLPAWPDNLKLVNVNPHNLDEYDEKALYAFVAGHGVRLPAKQISYSNVGVGLLGQASRQPGGHSVRGAAAPRGDEPTRDARHGHHNPPRNARAVRPRSRRHSQTSSCLGQQRRPRRGRRDSVNRRGHADLPRSSASPRPPAADGTCDCGGKDSRGGDPRLARGPGGRRRRRAHRAQLVHRCAGKLLAQRRLPLGYSACAIFNPEKDFAVVVLHNEAAERGFFMDRVGWHVVQRLTGLPAVSLAPASVSRGLPRPRALPRDSWCRPNARHACGQPFFLFLRRSTRSRPRGVWNGRRSDERTLPRPPFDVEPPRRPRPLRPRRPLALRVRPRRNRRAARQPRRRRHALGRRARRASLPALSHYAPPKLRGSRA